MQILSYLIISCFIQRSILYSIEVAQDRAAPYANAPFVSSAIDSCCLLMKTGYSFSAIVAVRSVQWIRNAVAGASSVET